MCIRDRVKDTIEARVDVLEKHVANHEEYCTSFENLKDFADALREEERKCNECSSEEQIGIYESIIPQESTGLSMLQACETRLLSVLAETDDAGKDTLTSEFDLQKRNLEEYYAKCRHTLRELRDKKDQTERLQGSVTTLGDFLKDVEAHFRDQSLKGTLDAKKAYLHDLKTIAVNVSSKEDEFNALKEKSQDVNTELADQFSKLMNRYQNVKTKVKVSVTCSKLVEYFFSSS